MTKANAESKAKEMKAATKKIAAKGVTRHKHVPQSEGTAPEGVDTTAEPVVESGFISPTDGAPDMTKHEAQATDTATPELTEAQAAAKAKQDEKAAELQAKMKAKAEKQEAAAKAKKEREEAMAANKEAREAKAKASKEAREARIAELAEASGGKRTYFGSMTALTERAKSGAYVKSMTGQLRSTDELAEVLDAVPAANVVKMGMAIFQETNKYAALNLGQQSMNYRNRLRGAIRKGIEIGGIKIDLELVKSVRDANNFATAEAEAAAKAEAKEAKAKAKEAAEAEKKAKADAAAKAKAEKDAAKTEVKEPEAA